MRDYLIREIRVTELNLLKDFLYEAIFQRDDNSLLPRDIIYQPELWQYIEGFDSDQDDCLVAVVEEAPIGAIWRRILPGGYGNVDDSTPELIISLYQEYRNRGIGTALMEEMLSRLKKAGYRQASLSVQRDNYAYQMYDQLGFRVVQELEGTAIMVCKL